MSRITWSTVWWLTCVKKCCLTVSYFKVSGLSHSRNGTFTHEANYSLSCQNCLPRVTDQLRNQTKSFKIHKVNFSLIFQQLLYAVACLPAACCCPSSVLSCWSCTGELAGLITSMGPPLVFSYRLEDTAGQVWNLSYYICQGETKFRHGMNDITLSTKERLRVLTNVLVLSAYLNNSQC